MSGIPARWGRDEERDIGRAVLDAEINGRLQTRKHQRWYVDCFGAAVGDRNATGEPRRRCCLSGSASAKSVSTAVVRPPSAAMPANERITDSLSLPRSASSRTRAVVSMLVSRFSTSKLAGSSDPTFLIDLAGKTKTQLSRNEWAQIPGRAENVGGASNDVSVTFAILPPSRVATLRATDFSYAAVGATAGESPNEFHSFTRSRVLSHLNFEAAVDVLMTWRMHQRAGLKVAASSARVEADSVVEMRLGVGRASLEIPCRVVYVVDEAEVRGFAYGTLLGHPESGEERFTVRRLPDGKVEATISAFSRPVTLAARLGGPLTGWIQRKMTDRYLSALDR